MFWVLVPFVFLLAAAPVRGGAETVPPDDLMPRIADLVRRGEDEAALRGLDDLPAFAKNRGDAGYLRGRLLMRLRRPCEAADAFYRNRRAAIPKPVHQEQARWLGRARAACGRCDEVGDALAPHDDVAVRQRHEDRLLLAKCALRLGDPKQSLDDLSALVRSPHLDSIAVQLLIADAQEKLGDAQGQVDALLAAWIAAGRRPNSKPAKALEARLPSTIVPSVEQRFERVQRLIRSRSHERALEELRHMEPSRSSSLRGRWLHLKGRALFGTRTRYADAARVLASAVRAGSPAPRDDAFLSARALSRAGNDRKAIVGYRRFAHQYRKHRLSREAEFLAAWLQMRSGRGATGVRAMRRVLKRNRSPKSRWHRKALWQLAFRAFERGRFKEATKLFRRFSSASRDSMNRARGLYWLGRSLRRGPKALQAYRAAAALEPFHWYAQLAAQRLANLGVPLVPPFESGRDSLSSSPVELPEVPAFYHRVGLDKQATHWTVRHRRQLTKGLAKDVALNRRISYLHAVNGYAAAIGLARSSHAIPRRAPHEESWWWRAMYPTPWSSVVGKQQVPAELLYGVMRQESGFNPLAVSRAGAQGLLQLMPHVAERHAEKLDLTWVPTLPLTPEYNIALGASELSDRLKEFRGNEPLAVASYNAGARRVRQWLKRTGRIELDRFVERIPFRETQNYVRRVMTHYERYRHLSDPKAPWNPLPRHVKP